jgi:hypothetical protein
MSDDDTKAMLTMLAKIVEQNHEIVKQNDRFLTFFEKRDALVAERTELEVKRLRDESEYVARFDATREAFGITLDTWAKIRLARELREFKYDSDMFNRLMADLTPHDSGSPEEAK